MMDREYLDEWIVRYTENTLEKQELTRFLEILERNPDIREEVELDKEILEFLRDRDLMEFRDAVERSRFRQRGDWRWNCFPLAALILLLLSVGGIWIYVVSLRGPHPFSRSDRAAGIPDPRAGTPTGEWFFSWRSPDYPGSAWKGMEPEPDLLAASFTPLPYLEELVGVVTRAGDLTLIRPGNLVKIWAGEPVTFAWQGSGISGLSVQITDNKGYPVWEKNGLTDSELIIPTGNWTPGLYYWKFLREENICRVGKIIVIR